MPQETLTTHLKAIDEISFEQHSPSFENLEESQLKVATLRQEEKQEEAIIQMAAHLSDSQLLYEMETGVRTQPFDSFNKLELEECVKALHGLGFKKARMNRKGQINPESMAFFNLVQNAYRMRKIQVLHNVDTPILEEIKEKFTPQRVIQKPKLILPKDHRSKKVAKRKAARDARKKQRSK